CWAGGRLRASVAGGLAGAADRGSATGRVSRWWGASVPSAVEGFPPMRRRVAVWSDFTGPSPVRDADEWGAADAGEDASLAGVGDVVVVGVGSPAAGIDQAGPYE